MDRLQLFLQLAEADPGLWAKLPGRLVVHVTHGEGIILSVVQSGPDSYRLDIHLAGQRRKFNHDSFCSKYFSEVSFPQEIDSRIDELLRQAADPG